MQPAAAAYPIPIARAGGNLYRVDPVTGATALIGGNGARLRSIVFDAGDVLYGAVSDPLGSGLKELRTIDTTTGASALVGATPDYLSGLAFDPSNGDLYASVDPDGIDVEGIYVIDQTDGTGVLLGTTGIGSVLDIHFDAAGNLYGVTDGTPPDLIAIDTLDGTGTSIGSTGFDGVVSGLDLAPLCGPELVLGRGSLSFALFVDAKATEELTIQNVAAPGCAPLSWSAALESQGGGACRWLSLSRDSGSAPSGGAHTVAVTASAAELAVGSHVCNIVVESNDPASSSVVIPVGVTVAAPEAAQVGVCYASLGNIDPDEGSLITIDLSTGAGTLVGPMGIHGELGAGVPALAVNSLGVLYATSSRFDSGLFIVDAGTAASGLAAGTPTRSLVHPDALAYSPEDVLYTVDRTNDLMTVDPITGDVTVIGDTGASPSIRSIEFDPTTGVLYGSGGDVIYAIDTTTGAATTIGATGLGGNTPGIVFDLAGNLFGSKGGGGAENSLISIDKTTGAGVVVGPIGFQAVSGMTLLARTPVSVTAAAPAGGRGLELLAPNPFSPVSGEVAFDVARAGHARLLVTDVAGRVVRTLFLGSLAPGRRELRWDGTGEGGRPLAGGVYFLELRQAGERVRRKIVLIP